MPRRGLVFLIDSSGSMDESLMNKRKLELVYDAVFEVIASEDLFSEDDLISIMLFHATKTGDVPKTDVLVPLMKVSEMRERLDSIRRRASRVRPVGGTPIGFGLRAAVEALAGVEADEKRVVLLTDGENNVGVSPVDVASDAAGQGVRIDVVGIGDEVNPVELGNVAEEAGGVFKQFPSDGDLTKILRSIIGRPVRELGEMKEGAELSELLRELRSVEAEARGLSGRLDRGEIGLNEYSEKVSELEFRKRELVSRIRDLRSELSRKLISAQLELERSPESEDLRSYVEELKRLLEESEIE
ncbi:MAG: VWA domain-containing protein [Thaumarchaeota archaeon]|nr:VWA domain-containing protein [Nitrososphaerota archaeon]